MTTTLDLNETKSLDHQLMQLRTELHEVTGRLARAEQTLRQNRRRWVGALVTAILLIVGGAAQLANRFPRLEVVGPNNDVRVAVSVNPDNGSAGLEVFGLNGRRVAFLGTSAEGTPNLALYDPAGQAIVRSFTP